MLEAKLLHNKTQTKNVKVAKMVEYIKTCDQYPCNFNFGNFFNSIILSPTFLLRKKISEKAADGQFPSPWGIMIKTWGRILLGGMSKNEQIQVFDSQMYLPVILTL